MVYELAIEYEERHQHSFHYRRRSDNRLCIDFLPLRSSLSASQEAFKKYFAERFNLGSSTFDEFLHTGLPRLQWECISLAFKINTQDWDPELLEPYLQWLMDTFAGIHAQAPKFLFFFVVAVKSAHERKKVHDDDQEILDTLDALLAKNSDQAILIENLPPVKTLDFETWLENLGNPTQLQKDQIIKTITERVPPEERQQYDTTKTLNMEHIEDFQERVYRYHAST
jgi:hypothetical protein